MYLHLIKRYLMLADQGIFDRCDCPLDPDHGRLYSNLDMNDKIFLYCIYCKYKDYLGLNTLQDMAKKVLSYDFEGDLRHLAGLE